MNKYPRGTSLYDYCINEHKEWILEQFDCDKNKPHSAKDFTKSSDTKVWFRFDCGHTCLQRIADKTGKDSKECPICLNRSGVGKSLESEYPYFSSMFDVDLNGITPNLVSHQNGKTYWWCCLRCGNKFKGKVCDVVNGKKVCNECSNKKHSFPEYCLAYYLVQIDNNRKMEKVVDGYKFDFFLPQYNLLIEYDGYPWHNTKESMKNDAIKDEIAKNNKYVMLRIRDERLNYNEKLTSHIWNFVYDYNLNFLKNLPKELNKLIGEKFELLDIDIKNDMRKIKSFQLETDKKDSLLACIPDINKYLDLNDKRNGKPEYVCNASHKIHFWFRHPQYNQLKWSMEAHSLFRKQEPYTQWIKMCIKIIEKYPMLEVQASNYCNAIRENSEFLLECPCGNQFVKTYAALMNKGVVKLCPDCIRKLRLENLERSRKKRE